MTSSGDVPAAEVFAIIEEPTVQTGRIRTFLLRLMAQASGQMIPGSTHPVVVYKATGKRVEGSTAASTFLVEAMQADLHTMSATDFRNRYLEF